MNTKRMWAALLPLCAAVAACGHAGGGSDELSQAALRGSVHGGQSPVGGSTVTLYAAGSGSGGAQVLGSATTSAGGSWSMSSFACPSPGVPTYVVASGGNPGLAAGTDNSALRMMAALGPCGGLAGSVNITEVTTVAAAYALNGFAGSGSGLSDVHGDDPGLGNAMANAARLASPATGLASASLPSAADCAGSSPPPNCGAEESLNSLANSLAACVNTTGADSPECVELFDCATPGATFSGGACTVPAGSTPAADTLTAILEIARNPGQVAAAGVADAATRNLVFSPVLSAAPNNWFLGLNIGGGGLDQPKGIAIDAAGNAWVASNGNSSLVELSPAGAALSGSGGYTAGGLNGPDGIAIDSSGNVWVVNGGGNGSLSEFSSTGVAASGSPFTGGGIYAPGFDAIDAGGHVWVEGFFSSLFELDSSGAAVTGSPFSGNGLDYPSGVAVDSGGNVWVSNTQSSGGGSGSLSEFTSGGAAAPGSPFTTTGLSGPQAIAIDPSGNVWVTNGGNTSLIEFSPAGAPLFSGSAFAGGICDVGGLAIDAAGQIWVSSGCSLGQFSSAGTPLSSGYTGGGFTGPGSVAIDPSGDVWTTNYSNNSVTELIGAAAPTRTPLVSAINSGFAP